MNVLYVIIPLALLLGGAFLAAFFWAINQGQYDDLDSPALRMLNENSDKTQRKDSNND